MEKNQKSNNLEVIRTTLNAANDDVKILFGVLKDLDGICITSPELVNNIRTAVRDCIIKRTKETIHQLSGAIE